MLCCYGDVNSFESSWQHSMNKLLHQSHEWLSKPHSDKDWQNIVETLVGARPGVSIGKIVILLICAHVSIFYI